MGHNVTNFTFQKNEPKTILIHQKHLIYTFLNVNFDGASSKISNDFQNVVSFLMVDI